jgi:ubiquinone biosynthesis monooxygenase Coq7
MLLASSAWRSFSCAVARVRLLSTARPTPSSKYLEASSLHDPAIAGSPSDLTPEQRETLDSALRVDHAGEIAANWIYKGQMVVLRNHPSAGALIQVWLSTKV